MILNASKNTKRKIRPEMFQVVEQEHLTLEKTPSSCYWFCNLRRFSTRCKETLFCYFLNSTVSSVFSLHEQVKFPTTKLNFLCLNLLFVTIYWVVCNPPPKKKKIKKVKNKCSLCIMAAANEPLIDSKWYWIDLFSLGGLFSHFRPRDIP